LPAPLTPHLLPSTPPFRSHCPAPETPGWYPGRGATPAPHSGTPRAKGPTPPGNPAVPWHRPPAPEPRGCPARRTPPAPSPTPPRSEEHTSELQSRENLVCR